MKKIILNVLSDSAMDELKEMENDRKIHILNEDDFRRLAEQKEKIWKELEEYTYDNIIKKVKGSVG